MSYNISFIDTFLYYLQTSGRTSHTSSITSQDEAEPSTSVDSGDHIYSYTPLRKRSKVEKIEEAYNETIQELKEIKKIIDKRLSDLTDAVKELVETIKNKGRNC